jgi:hypothetical protein
MSQASEPPAAVVCSAHSHAVRSAHSHTVRSAHSRDGLAPIWNGTGAGGWIGGLRLETHDLTAGAGEAQNPARPYEVAGARIVDCLRRKARKQISPEGQRPSRQRRIDIHYAFTAIACSLVCLNALEGRF